MSDGNLKRQHEKGVCDRLLAVLGQSLTFVREGDDKGEPDMLYEESTGSIGIEVAGAYYERSDAKDGWAAARGKEEFSPEEYKFRSGGTLANPDAKICAAIQSQVEAKCIKRYGGTAQVWLCIDVDAPLSDDASLRDCLSHLRIPTGHIYSHIYLIHRDGGGDNVLEIK
jgi:hypothetical protein